MSVRRTSGIAVAVAVGTSSSKREVVHPTRRTRFRDNSTQTNDAIPLYRTWSVILTAMASSWSVFCVDLGGGSRSVLRAWVDCFGSKPVRG